jgi:hypothetical protein
MITNNNVDEYIELLKARIVLLVIALALFAAGCDTKALEAGTTAQRDAGTTAQLDAEKYACSSEEVKSMQAYYRTCMDGAGYFSHYCLDRAVLAACHPREPKKEETK